MVERPLTFRQFIEAPYPVGVGSSVREIKKIVSVRSRNEAHPETAEALASMRRAVDDLVNEPLPAHGGDHSGQDNNIILPPPEQQGTSREYTVRRLKRDRPDLAALVIGGAMSANARLPTLPCLENGVVAGQTGWATRNRPKRGR